MGQNGVAEMSKLEKEIINILVVWAEKVGIAHLPLSLSKEIMEAISKHMAKCPRLTDVEQITIIEEQRQSEFGYTPSHKDMVIIGAEAQYKLCEEHLLKEDE